jgi:hypothetical protein
LRLLPYSQSGQLLRSTVEPSYTTGSLAKEDGKGGLMIKALRSKWEAWRLKLAPGDRVSVGLKSYKLLRG